MKKNTLPVLVIGFFSILPLASQAKDERLKFSIADALNSPGAQGRLDSGIKLFWGDQGHPNPVQTYGDFTANKKTNAFNKSDKEACEWNFASAVISLQERARKEGGNAVINIHSVYREGNLVSATEYECGVGAFVSGVALRGTVVKLP
jgi:hypothetical protein